MSGPRELHPQENLTRPLGVMTANIQLRVYQELPARPSQDITVVLVAPILAGSSQATVIPGKQVLPPLLASSLPQDLAMSHVEHLGGSWRRMRRKKWLVPLLLSLE